MPTSTDVKRLRRSKLPFPRMQCKLVAVSTLLVTIALLVQYSLITSKLVGLLTETPGGIEYVAAELPGKLLTTLVVSLAILLPLTTALGILTTFRWAGPLYRFHAYLREAARGRTEGPCRIRSEDELQELCVLINEALAAARAAGARDTTEDPAETGAQRAA